MVGFTIGSGNPQGVNEEAEDSGLKYGNPVIQNTPAPASFSAASAPTAQQVVNGIITQSTATAQNMTLPSAAAIAQVLRGFSSRGVVVGDTIYLTIVAGGAGAVTIVAGSGITPDANTSTSVPAGTERTLALRFSNGTPGSEALVYY